MAELNQLTIAKMAKVSQATVSRVLNNDPQVNPELRARVLVAIETVNYVPNARAQSLRSQRSQLIGLVMHRAPRELAADPFFSALAAAILEHGGARGYHLCVDASRGLQSRRAIYDELLRTRRVDGLILVEPETEDDRIAQLNAQGFPFVLIGSYDRDPSVLSVDNDNAGAAKMATDYLISNKRHRIAYIGGPRDVNVTADRLHGYQQGLAARGIDFDPQLVAYTDFTEESGHRAMRELLETRPTAVLALDDLLAIGALRAIKERGLKCPEDVAVIGFNDSAICQFTDPPLTSVAVDINELARQAIEMLVDAIEERPVLPTRRIVPARLIRRASA